MTTTYWLSGFEAGAIAGNSGGIFDFLNNSAQLSSVAGIRGTGSKAFQVAANATAGGTSGRVDVAAGNKVVVVRFYVTFPTLPTSNCQVAVFGLSGGTNVLVRFNSATNKLQPRIGSTSGTDVNQVLTAGVVYRVDAKVDASGSTNVLMDMKVTPDGGSTVTGTQLATAVASLPLDITTFRFGTSTTDTFTAKYDDAHISVTGADYPIGDTTGIVGLHPTEDGTHSPATPDCFRGNGTLISGSNPAYQYLDDNPLPTGTSPTTDIVVQDTVHSTHYAEVGQSASGMPYVSTVHGVRALVSWGTDSTAPNDGKTRVVYADGTVAAVVYSGDMSEITVFSKSALVPAPAGGWSHGEITGLKWQFGLSIDVSPLPTWQALMMEVDYDTGPPPTITLSPSTLPDGTRGVAYSQSVSASGGTGPYTFAVTAGTLPAGLSLASSGAISGTPTGTGTSSGIEITATDALSNTGFETYSITIGAATITVSPTSLPNGAVDASYSETLTASGGSGSYTWVHTSGSLPPGVTFAGGVFSGNPTTAGTYGSILITATDTYGNSGNRTYSIVIDAAAIVITPTVQPNAVEGAAYSQTMTASGGLGGSFTWSRTGTLPTGVTFNTSTHVFAGTPGGGTAGVYTGTLTATDASGSGTLDYSIQVISSGFAWSTAGTLPPGLTFDPEAADLTGTVTTEGTYLFTVTATDVDGNAGTNAYTLVVSPPAGPPIVPGHETAHGISHGPDGADPIYTPPSVSGSRGSNAALASLLTALEALGIIVDNSS